VLVGLVRVIGVDGNGLNYSWFWCRLCLCLWLGLWSRLRWFSRRRSSSSSNLGYLATALLLNRCARVGRLRDLGFDLRWSRLTDRPKSLKKGRFKGCAVMDMEKSLSKDDFICRGHGREGVKT
jgi:hypothetical protein